VSDWLGLAGADGFSLLFMTSLIGGTMYQGRVGWLAVFSLLSLMIRIE
jgi:hypothetical protein